MFLFINSFKSDFVSPRVCIASIGDVFLLLTFYSSITDDNIGQFRSMTGKCLPASQLFFAYAKEFYIHVLSPHKYMQSISNW